MTSKFVIQLLICGIFLTNVIYILNYFYNVNNIFKNNVEIEEKSNFKLPFTLQNEIISRNLKENISSCFTSPFRCNNSNCDCAKICGSDKFELIHIPNNDVIYNKRKLQPGYYCMMKEIKRKCLAGVSMTIFENDEWHCMCKYPTIFSGKFCSDFIACKAPYQLSKSLLWDFKNNAKADLTNFSQDFYELLPNTNEYRFRCKCDGVDNAGNKMIGFDFAPFECFQDPCKSNLQFSSVDGYNNETMECDCGNYDVTRQKNMIENDKLTPCTPCYSLFSNNEIQFTAHCYNNFSITKDFEYDFYPCVNFEEQVTTCIIGKLSVSEIL